MSVEFLDDRYPREDQIRRFGFCWDDCGGFGEYHDFWSFAEKVVQAAPSGSTIVEVGSFRGRSVICLGLFAKEANKGIKILSVDDGSLGANNELMDNVSKAGLDRVITVVRKTNIDAAKSVPDNSCWLVFLDDDHRHEQVAEGVRAWMPKVVDRGWLTGHDALWHTVAEPVIALVGRENLIRSDWRDIWIVGKRPLAENANIYGQTSLPDISKGSWVP